MSQTTIAQAPKNKPEFKIRLGNISVSAFKNIFTKDKVSFPKYSFSIQRSYLAGEKWDYSNSLNLNDIPKAIECLRQAWLKAQEKTPENEEQ